jgi:hypothetical protein
MIPLDAVPIISILVYFLPMPGCNTYNGFRMATGAKYSMNFYYGSNYFNPGTPKMVDRFPNLPVFLPNRSFAQA